MPFNNPYKQPINTTTTGVKMLREEGKFHKALKELDTAMTFVKNRPDRMQFLRSFRSETRAAAAQAAGEGQSGAAGGGGRGGGGGGGGGGSNGSKKAGREKKKGKKKGMTGESRAHVKQEILALGKEKQKGSPQLWVQSVGEAFGAVLRNLEDGGEEGANAGIEGGHGGGGGGTLT